MLEVKDVDTLRSNNRRPISNTLWACAHLIILNFSQFSGFKVLCQGLQAWSRGAFLRTNASLTFQQPLDLGEEDRLELLMGENGTAYDRHFHPLFYFFYQLCLTILERSNCFT